MRDHFRGPGQVSRFEPWPWAVGVVLAAFVLMQIGLVTLANRSFEGPDDPGYYKMGLEYDRHQAHHREGWHVVSNLPEQLRAGQPVQLVAQVFDQAGRPVEGQVTARVGRPATRSQDRSLRLPTAWTPERGWWTVSYELDGQRLDQVRVHVP